MKHLKGCFVYCLVFVMVFCGGCQTNSDNTDFHNLKFPVTVYEDIVVEEGFLYSGEFPEDVSFSSKKDVFALKILNNSDKDLRLIRIYVTTGDGEMLFEVTTLPAKATVTVLEKNGNTLKRNEEIIEFRAENVIFFEDKITVKADNIELTPLNSVLNIKNISNKDISADIYVYYKKVDENGDLFGGITFRSRAEGLKADELKQLPASHYDTKNSKVIFVEYFE